MFTVTPSESSILNPKINLFSVKFKYSDLVNQNKIFYRETITDGFENAPQALRDVLSGKNFGKQIIKI